jgi:hypothetical protein
MRFVYYTKVYFSMLEILFAWSEDLGVHQT